MPRHSAPPRQLDLFPESSSSRASSRPSPSSQPPTPRDRPAHPSPSSDEQLPADPLEAFIAALETLGRSHHTLQSVRLDLRQLARFLGPRPLTAATPRDLRLFVRHLAIEQRNRPSSLRRKIASLKAFGRFLQQTGLAGENPAARLRYPPPLSAAPRALSDAECHRLAGAARDHSPLWHALILALLETGLKRDEVLALRRSDLRLAHSPEPGGTLHLRRRRDAQRTRLRSVPVTPVLVPALTEWIEHLPDNEPRLFPLSPRGVDYIVEQCGRLAGIRSVRKVTPTTLRDTFAIRCLREFVKREQTLLGAGADPAEVERLKARHNLSLLRQLGLSSTSAAIDRYRAAVESSAEPQPPTG